MKFCDINKRFTNLVTEYIGKGYTFNTSSMGGSQGEIANVDLTNGKEIIRILVENFSDWHENVEGVKIVIGKSTDRVIPHSWHTFETVWNTHLEVIYTEFFYKIGRRGNYYGTKEEAEVARNIGRERYKRREIRHTEYFPNDKAKAIAERVVRNKFGYRRINPAEVRISKTCDGYYVVYRNNAYRLH